MPRCEKCQVRFPNSIKLDGKRRNLQNRKYCLDCSPFGKHNTKNFASVIKTLQLCRVCGRNYQGGKGKYSQICPSCRVTQIRQKNKKQAVALMGGKCIICGYDKCIASLTFHHIKPDEKELEISSSSIAWSRIEEELKKCILVCNRCHVEIHRGLISIPLKDGTESIDRRETNNRLISLLVFDSADSRDRWHKIPVVLRKLINNGDGSYSCQFAQETCLYCNKLLTARSQDTYCSQQCFRLASRKVKRPSQEDLAKMIWEKPTSQIAKDFGVSGKAIEKWCKTYGIEKPPRGYWAKKQYGKL